MYQFTFARFCSIYELFLQYKAERMLQKIL